MLPYTTPDFQHPDTGVPCAFEWDEETMQLTLQPCETLIQQWNLEEDSPEAVKETKEMCMRFGTIYCESLEDAYKIIMQTRYNDNADVLF